jgi:hypothetical protein
MLRVDWYVHLSFERSSGVAGLVRTVNVLLLAASLLAGADAKFSAPCPITRALEGSRLVRLAVMGPMVVVPVFNRSARYVMYDCVPVTAICLTRE